MKKLLTRATLAAAALVAAIAFIAPAHGQAEKVKEKAKDLKKKVEGGQSSTNKPPEKAPPPQKPAK